MIVAELTVTAAPPVEVRVTCCVVGVLTCTSPKATVEALTLSVAIAGLSVRANVLDTLPALAVSVTVCAADMDDTVAVNAALLALAGTVTTAGTVTELLLLEILTLNELGVDTVLKVTVQASVPALLIVDALHDSADSVGVEVPVPLSEMVCGEVLAVSTILTAAVMVPAAVGEKCT